MVDASISLVVGAAGWLIGFPFEDCCWSPNYRAPVLLATRDARAGGTRAFPGRGACRQPGAEQRIGDVRRAAPWCGISLPPSARGFSLRFFWRTCWHSPPILPPSLNVLQYARHSP